MRSKAHLHVGCARTRLYERSRNCVHHRPSVKSSTKSGPRSGNTILARVARRCKRGARGKQTWTHTHTHAHTRTHTHTARNKEVTPCCGRFRSQLCPQLLKLNSYVLHSVRNIMAMYCVYVVYAVTKRGTRRVYVGSTYALDVRKFFHKVTGPCWLRACKVEDFLILLILFRLSAPIDSF